MEEVDVIKVKLKEGNAMIKELKQKGLLNLDYKIKKEGSFLLIPLNKSVDGSFRAPMEKRSRKKSFKELLREKGIEQNISSFDIIGEAAVVYIPEGVDEKKVAEALMEASGVKAVYRKLPVEGEFRVRELKLIKGEEVREVLYKENGVIMKFDITKVFFSPRLAYERLRVAKSVKGKNILVLFAGVGPFALVIAKMHRHAKVVGIELNPIAVKYFKENVALNKLSNVEVIEGDVREVLKDKRFYKWADEVIMPLPKDAQRFLKYVEGCVKKGSVIYIYLFMKKDIDEGEIVEEIKKYFNKKFVVRRIRKVKEYSPSIDEFVVEIVVDT